MRVGHYGRLAKQYGFDFLTGNAVLAAFGPVAFIPIKARDLHKGKAYTNV